MPMHIPTEFEKGMKVQNDDSVLFSDGEEVPFKKRCRNRLFLLLVSSLSIYIFVRSYCGLFNRLYL